jgi:putative ATP-dependent endonuclease of OLD family
LARIRKIEIARFHSIRSFDWLPSSGVYCLIGPGVSKKSHDSRRARLLLGARRTVQFNDADFYALDVTEPMSITLAIGELDDALKNMETYGH